jgi:glyoxylase-like metal-dependent hydrolase (beta-lactamase superfamily II)
MTRKFLAVVAVVVLLCGAASAQDAKTVIDDATKAMGYAGLNTIVYSGPLSHEGAATLGQWMGPTKGWHGNTVKNFTRFIDYSAGTSQRTGLQSRPGDPATGLLAGGAGLDPSTAENPNTQNVPATGAWATRLDVLLSPPAFLKAAAAASNATVKKQGKYLVVSFDSGQKAPSGVPYKLSGYIDSKTKILEKVQTAYEDESAGNGYLLGDVLVEQTYSDFKDFNGVKFPTQIRQSRAGVPFSDATITDVKPNAPAPAAPAAAAAAPGAGGGRGGAPGAGGAGAAGGGRGGDGRGGDGGGRGGAAAGAPGGGAAAAGGRGGGAGAPAAGAPGAGGRGGAGGGAGAGAGAGGGGNAAAAAAGPRKLAEGVFVLISGGSRAMAVEMKDGIVMIDAPPAAAEALVAQAKASIPNKPITHFITSHMHFDHVGGMRTVLGDGPKEVTLVTNVMNKDIIEDWLRNPHTLQAVTPTGGVVPPPPAAAPAGGGGRGGAAAPAPWPDALARSGKKVKFQYVKDKLVMKDNVNTIEIYPIKGVLHSEDMMVIYVPKAKAIYQADAYNPAAQPGAVTNPTTNGGQLAFQKLLASELDRLKIVDYETIVAGHTRDASKQDLLVAIGRVPPPPAAAPAAPAAGGRGQ